MDTEEARRRRAAYERKRRKKQKRNRQILRRLGLAIVILLAVIIGIIKLPGVFARIGNTSGESKAEKDRQVEDAPDFQVSLLTPNAYSRPQTELKKVKGIVVHYTANPGTTAKQNRNYFEGLKDSKETKASSHFVVGLEGEIVQCIPTAEISYASNDRNADTISIECCHADQTGKFNQATYDSLVHLTAWLCGKFGLGAEDVIRHYDVTGKECPLYFVEHEDAWEQFKIDVDQYIEEHGVSNKET